MSASTQKLTFDQWCAELEQLGGVSCAQAVRWLMARPGIGFTTLAVAKGAGISKEGARRALERAWRCGGEDYSKIQRTLLDGPSPYVLWSYRP